MTNSQDPSAVLAKVNAKAFLVGEAIDNYGDEEASCAWFDLCKTFLSQVEEIKRLRGALEVYADGENRSVDNGRAARQALSPQSNNE